MNSVALKMTVNPNPNPNPDLKMTHLGYLGVAGRGLGVVGILFLGWVFQSMGRVPWKFGEDPTSGSWVPWSCGFATFFAKVSFRQWNPNLRNNGLILWRRSCLYSCAKVQLYSIGVVVSEALVWELICAAVGTVELFFSIGFRRVSSIPL